MFLTVNCHQPSRCSSDATSATVRTQSRTVTVTAMGNNGRNPESRSVVTADDFGVLISAHSHTSRTHTVETTMVSLIVCLFVCLFANSLA